MMLGPMQTFVLAQHGMWDPIITWMQIIVGTAATLTIITGATIIALAPYDEDKQIIGAQMVGSAVVGLLIALLAVPAFNLIDGWMTGREDDDQGDSGALILAAGDTDHRPPHDRVGVVPDADAPADLGHQAATFDSGARS